MRGHHHALKVDTSGRWGERHEFDAMACTTLDRQPAADDLYSHGVSLSIDALDAHRQVLEMAATIEILTRDFENQQQELLDAYKRLKQYADRELTTPTEKSVAAKLFRHGGDDNNSCDGMHEYCAHQQELEELRKLLDVKDSALTEALHQRNEYRIELERAEAVIKEFRSTHVDTNGQHRASWKIHPTVSNMAGYHASGVAMPSTHASLAPGYASSGGASASFTIGIAGAIEVPRNERFDNESTYQRKENDDLFWRKQYKEAIRMRKKYGLVDQISSSNYSSTTHRNSSNGNGPTNAARPSLKIFSYPDNRRQKGIKDENVPFSRYIGISARQHEIIKEQHRMLAWIRPQSESAMNGYLFEG
uniref:Uncharacterized protein n=1 Tax=Globisporangium ultimum (strain ATCC 200006 / CBS 805.95 / DAOM BR144) TaxID=431595 RepID=K3WZP7_GLOUD